MPAADHDGVVRLARRLLHRADGTRDSRPSLPTTAVTSRGGGRPSSTRSTSAASPTPTATASATSPGSAARLPYLSRARRRCHLADPVLPVAAGRRRLRRRRLPRHRPAVRHPRRLRRAARRRPRPRAAGDRRPRPQPHVRRAPVVPRRARRAARAARSGARYLFRDGSRTATVERRRTTGEHVRRPGVDPRRRRRRDARAVVPAPVRRRSSPTSTGRTRRCGPSSSRSCASGSTAASTASASTSPTGWPRTRRCPTSAAVRPPTVRRPPSRPPALGPGRGPRRLPRVAAAERRLSPASGCSSARRGSRPRSASPATCAPTSCTRRSTSTSCSRRWDAAALRTAIDAQHRRPRRGRRAADVGAVEPRRRPPRHPLRRRRAGHAPSPCRARC